MSDEYESCKVAGSDGKQYDLVVRRSNHQAVDCTCPDREHKGRFQGRACKHMQAHAQAVAKEHAEMVLAAFRDGMDCNGCIEKEQLLALSGLDIIQARQAIYFLNDAGQQIVWMRSEFGYWQWQNFTVQKAA